MIVVLASHIVNLGRATRNVRERRSKPARAGTVPATVAPVLWRWLGMLSNILAP